ncbi:BppU family phage baseplate upper protein [Clostridium sp. Ade.TY]|uniref:BppU family phage baseplate upper protein n=1 Tax=Clostridium sp. Ade.TY TaxID=1391647 RepID=UPI0004095239|nr:BppU family phage baseplate upper protein [Clostridium sp. Ade.TY]
MREIFIDVVNGSDSTIKVTQNDNLTGSYKLIITENSRRLDLTDKNIKFAFVKSDSHLGDIIEDLRVSNPIQGEIDFPITNRITKVDGLYSCGIAIYNSTGYLEHTGTFNLYVRENIFEKVSGELLENSAYKELMSLLDKATNLNAELNPLVTNGTALKNDLENDINKANNLKNDLEINTNRATAINDTLVKNTATAEEKNTTLNNSLNETKKYIENLDGSQNLPQMRDDITVLQNGLKSNQELAYEGQSLKCENTLDGRIEDIVLEGITYQNLLKFQKDSFIIRSNGTNTNISSKTILLNKKLKPSTTYTLVYTVKQNVRNNNINIGGNATFIDAGLIKTVGTNKTRFTTKSENVDDSRNLGITIYIFNTSSTDNLIEMCEVYLLEGDYTNKYIPSYFEGIKSVGEAEENKVNTLSCGKNLCAHLESGGTNGTDRDFGIDYNNPAYIRSNYINVEGMDYLACNVTNDKNSSIRFNVYCFYDSNKKGIKPYLYSKAGKVPENAKYCRVEITTNGSKEDISSYIDTTKCIVIQDKIIPNIFEPYKSDKRELKLPFSDGLKGLPNGVKDLIYNKDDGCYVKQRIDKKLFNGGVDENWYLSGVENEGYITFHTAQKLGGTNGCSNLFNLNPETYNSTHKGEGFYPSTQYNVIYFKIAKNKLETQDVAGFKKWLQANPVEVYYELAEPVETKISDTKLSLDTYNALTYVFSNNAISPNIKMKVASNLGSIIQQNAKSINDIYKLIDEVLIPQIATNTADIAISKLK